MIGKNIEDFGLFVLMSFRAIEKLTLDAFMEFRKTNSSKKKNCPILKFVLAIRHIGFDQELPSHWAIILSKKYAHLSGMKLLSCNILSDLKKKPARRL